MKIGKSEARCRHGVWRGMVEVSDEHLTGTDLSVIKCRADAPLAADKRFDPTALEMMRGMPWRPFAKHSE